MKPVKARTSSSRAVSGPRTYDAFGNTVGFTGTWAGPSGYGGRFGYREDGTALRLVGHRLYDPAAGRFVSRDPARDGGNWYQYCGGDPVNGADPTGLIAPLILGAVLISLASLWRLAHEADKIIEKAREEPRTPGANLYGDEEKLHRRHKEQVPPWIEETKKIAVDQFKDQYIYGPIGEAGGDGAKIMIEGGKQITEYIIP